MPNSTEQQEETTSIEATPNGVTVEMANRNDDKNGAEPVDMQQLQLAEDPKGTTAVVSDKKSKSQRFSLTQSSKEKSRKKEEDDRSSSHDETEHVDDLFSGGVGQNPIKKLFHSSHRSVKVKEEMESVRDAMADTYQKEGNKVLLHGYLHINIIRARGLRNLDCLRGLHTAVPSAIFMCLATDVSDPYVTVHAGKHRLIKTSTIFDDLNPEWNTEYFVPICDHIDHLEFRVKDWDRVSNEILGRVLLPASDLIRFGGPDGKQRRTGIHRVVYLDGKARHGAFEFYAEYVPKHMMHDSLARRKGVEAVTEVPGTYFKPQKLNQMRLYVNADDKSEELGTPKVTYGKDNSKTWKPQRLWKDIYDSICGAKHLIYIVGWSVDYTQSLMRGEESKTALVKRPGSNGSYSSYIGELLKQKANDGVNVNLLVWDDNTSNTLKKEGVVATRDEELRQFFAGTKVTLRLVPMAAGTSNFIKQIRQSVYFTHHQKCVIADAPNDELVAYVGGVDLTYGRYDDGSYPLFRTLQGVHREDFHQACFQVNQASGPREPWHDIHNRVQGPVILDLVKNFEERWIGQGGQVSELSDLDELGLRATCVDIDESESWNTQLFRSIDSRTAKFEKRDAEPTHFNNIKGVTFEGEGKDMERGKRAKMIQMLLKAGKEYERSFVADSAEGFEFNSDLHLKREVKIDNSVHSGLVHHIRNSEHTLYIESQYFLGSSFMWKEDQTKLCCNLIPAEITFKICEKIEAGERFAAYIVVPMWPEGLPESQSVQDILYYQYQTVQSMYMRIAGVIKRRKKQLEKENKTDELSNVEPSDYLNFYCLANRETAEGGMDSNTSVASVLNRTRRHLVYCHSKMTIVDDAVAIIGSANMNQRSLDGNRDSELLLGAWQPAYLASKESIAQGEVHGFRLHCWAHLTGVMEDVFRDPASLDCVRRVNEIAETNWCLYAQDEVCEMKSYLVSYPYMVDGDGTVYARTDDGKFPDTNANILGTKPGLPQYLTT